MSGSSDSPALRPAECAGRCSPRSKRPKDAGGKRKRDQTPDAFGLAVKRELLQRAIEDDPAAGSIRRMAAQLSSHLRGAGARRARAAMARAVFEEWRLAHSLGEFRRGLSRERRQTMRTNETPSELDVRARAIVLAGGRSSRMGTSKALLLFDGEPLIVHVVATLRRLFDDVVVVASPGQDLPSMPVTLVRDEVAYQGPVGGMYYGLRAATGELCFVTACDSAFLNPPLISHLVGRSADRDVVVPHWQGRFQPLHAVYRRSVLPLLEGQLARGELRPVYLFEKVRTLRIDEEEIRRFDPEG